MPKIQENQTPDYSLGRVEKIQGKYVFLHSEPVQEYEVVFRVKTINWDCTTGTVVDKAIKISEKEGKEFDAVLVKFTQSGDVAIKFKKP